MAAESEQSQYEAWIRLNSKGLLQETSLWLFLHRWLCLNC